MTAIKLVFNKVSPEKLFMGSVLVVNGGNYLYNLILGRLLGPAAYSDAALLTTLLLVLSFLGMTFQLATAKFAILFTGDNWVAFKQLLYTNALGFGTLIGVLLFAFAGHLQTLFHTESDLPFKTFAVSVPLYFFMSVNRGRYQGNQDYQKLSITYQTEMWSRLILTLALLLVVPTTPAFLVSLGIVLSFVFGLIPTNFSIKNLKKKVSLSKENKRKVISFIALTACYELTQIIINNSDVLLVKHYFDTVNAGLYASLAMIGRVVYFVAWMFVMLLLPAVVQKQKDGEATAPILIKYVSYVAVLAISIIFCCAVFPKLIIQLMFGDAYISMAPLLWQYALATSLFAISNLFAYYFLSLDQYVPVILSGVLGISQIIMIIFFHSSLYMVVQVQIIAMVALLVAQLLYFTTNNILNKTI
ncbi:oligosaccharide flippase family protein [Maribacter stanieri]|uniref:Membrane protein involved in the export of O-antigen and teichoic acid n=1 Tax=Maribacter stanieri TaxID=440514 RepID=A0A1I6IPD4_9FLAO|nr:oligosaccharide flippase family protein [Maribacter stanieri]SFR68586.1 Membrane protein involved in the export of O-antigen and teichoic acid [Maribacter stanieri]